MRGLGCEIPVARFGDWRMGRRGDWRIRKSTKQVTDETFLAKEAKKQICKFTIPRQ